MKNTSITIVLSFLSFILIALSAIFSIAESSFLSINKLKLALLCNKQDKRALRTQRLLQDKDTLINTLLVGNDLVNILLSSIVTYIFINAIGQKGVFLSTISVTILLLLFGEITPKTLSLRNPNSIALFLSLFIQCTVFLLHPIVMLFSATSNLVLRLRHIDIKEKTKTYTHEDIASYIDAIRAGDTIKKTQKRMLNTVFKFQDLPASAIMVSRLSIVSFSSDTTLDKVLVVAKSSQYSYYPVYKGSIDNIESILYIKDLLSLVASNPLITKDKMLELTLETPLIRKILHKPLFIPSTSKMSTVEEVLTQNKERFAIVIDEYSGTKGILTRKSICKSIFGDIGSKAVKDNLPSFPLYLTGDTLLVGVNERLKTSYTSRINKTIGGYISEKLGRVPVINDKIKSEGFTFTVEKVTRRAVERVKVTPLKTNIKIKDDKEEVIVE